jgi:predicted nucleic acid-binding protein
MNATNAFLDTNILVYAADSRVAWKQQRARALLAELESRESGWISTQVAAEYFSAIIRKLPTPFSVQDAITEVEQQLEVWNVVAVSEIVVRTALGLARTSGVSYWDAQIVAAAAENNISLLFTEDMQHDSVISGVRILNPFHKDFRLADWLT